jgi:hypothetical protein
MVWKRRTRGTPLRVVLSNNHPLTTQTAYPRPMNGSILTIYDTQERYIPVNNNILN